MFVLFFVLFLFLFFWGERGAKGGGADLRLEGQEDGIAMIFPLSHLLCTKSKGGGGAMGGPMV